MSETGGNILFGKFAAEECLKKDESGSVWRARHIHLDQPVILKILQLGSLADPALAERFRREARLLARLSHPNIIRVLDFSVEPGCFYISFEYALGVSLRARLQQQLSLAEKCGILRQVAAALAAAHAQQIIHRDVKPENILIDERGRVKLADFGLALLQEGAAVTRKSAVVGTPGYMSPEQIRGETLTPASDLFALGIVAHELFFGRHPFIAAEVGETLNNILAGEEATLPAEPNLPPSLRELVTGLLRKDRRERVASADEVVRRLEWHFPAAAPEQGAEAAEPAGGQSTARPAGSPLRPQRRLRLAGMGFLTLVMAVALLLLKYPAPMEQHLPALRMARSDSSATLQPPLTATRLQHAAAAESARIRMAVDQSIINQSARAGERPSAGLPAGQGAGAGAPMPSAAKKDSVSLISGVPFGMAAEAAAPGKLFVTCEPWAEVFIDSVRVDATPLQDTLRLSPGMHELVLKHPDYPASRQILRIAPRQTLRIAVDLDTLFGFLDLRIWPWAEVWLDGVARGQTPFARPLVLEEGGHRLSLHHPQYGELQDYIKVTKSETTRYTLNMSQLAGRPR